MEQHRQFYVPIHCLKWHFERHLQNSMTNELFRLALVERHFSGADYKHYDQFAAAVVATVVVADLYSRH